MSSKYYTVYLNKDDSVVACGTSVECIRQMHLKTANAFYSMVSKANRGRRSRYTVVVDEDEYSEVE